MNSFSSISLRRICAECQRQFACAPVELNEPRQTQIFTSRQARRTEVGRGPLTCGEGNSICGSSLSPACAAWRAVSASCFACRAATFSRNCRQCKHRGGERIRFEQNRRQARRGRACRGNKGLLWKNGQKTLSGLKITPPGGEARAAACGPSPAAPAAIRLALARRTTRRATYRWMQRRPSLASAPASSGVSPDACGPPLPGISHTVVSR